EPGAPEGCGGGGAYGPTGTAGRAGARPVSARRCLLQRRDLRNLNFFLPASPACPDQRWFLRLISCPPLTSQNCPPFFSLPRWNSPVRMRNDSGGSGRRRRQGKELLRSGGGNGVVLGLWQGGAGRRRKTARCSCRTESCETGRVAKAAGEGDTRCAPSDFRNTGILTFSNLPQASRRNPLGHLPPRKTPLNLSITPADYLPQLNRHFSTFPEGAKRRGRRQARDGTGNLDLWRQGG